MGIFSCILYKYIETESLDYKVGEFLSLKETASFPKLLHHVSLPLVIKRVPVALYPYQPLVLLIF